MKKSLLLILLLLAVLVPWTAKAQTPTIETIGTGSYETDVVFPCYYKYWYSVFLYRPDEADVMNYDFNLSSIAYDVTRSNATIDELTIWVKDVDRSEYLDPNQPFPTYFNQSRPFSFYIDGATQVYATQTPFSLNAWTWNTFNFTTNFSHQAGKELLVAVRGVCNNTVTGNNIPECHYTYNSYLVWHRGSDADQGLSTTGYVTADLANIQLGLTYATDFPSDLTVTYPEGIDTQVTLGWTENGEATAWQICLNDDETHLIEANSNPFTLTNLTPETTYTAKVRANHGDTQSDWSTAVSFTPTLKTVLGTGGDTFGFLPCDPNYNYSLTQQIYTAAELGDAAELLSIDFYNDGTGQATRNLQIYIAHTDQDAILYSNWIDVASGDLVFSGSVHFVSKGWTSIVLDTPFAYDGQRNVVITVDDNTGNTAGQSGFNFLCYGVPGAGDQSRYYIGYTNYDPTNNPGVSLNVSNLKNHIRVMKAYAPTNLTVSDVTSQGATLGWTENGTATSWQICLNGDMNNLITVTENPYTLTGLTYGVTYTAKVRANCADGHTTWSNEVNFAIPTPLPYSTDFETTCDWIFENPGNHNLNAWVWGTATSNGGTHSLYVSNDGGAHWEYTSQQFESNYAYKYFWFEPGVYHLSFDWKADGVWGENSGQIQMLDYLTVTLRDENYHAIYGSYDMGRQVNWQTVNADVTVSTAGVYRLEFQWVIAAPLFGYNDTGWPAAIDNVSITPASSLMPTNLQCTAASNTQATLGWTENNSNATGWQICLNGNESNLIDASTNPFTLTNLTTDATYTAKVRSITPNGESAWSDEISFVPTIKTVLGTGTETSVELPFANHTDVETQQIYTADELGAAGDILSIGFYKTGTTTCTRNLKIYMALTTTNKYTTAGDWVNTGNGQLVFSGTVSFADDAWTTINLATPFHYDGQQNLAITVIDNTGSTGGQARFLSYTAPEKQTIVYHSINQALTAYLLNDKSQIRMLKSAVHTAVTGYDGEDDGNWQLVALPIAGTIDPVEYTNMITSSTFDLYRFNHSAAAEWENWKNTESGHYHFNMESGHGYLYANNEDIRIVFSGTPYSGNGQVTLSKDDNARFGQWNLIGNPFSTNATLGDKPFYIMNSGGTDIIPATDNTIAAMQGVFVEADQNGEVISFMAQSRGGENANEDLVLNLCKGPSTGSGNATTAAIDRVIVRMDKGEALHKLQIKDDNTKVYIPLDGKDYAIVTIGRDGVHTVSTGVNEIPVNFHAAENGTYTFTANFEGVEMEYLHLIDNMTGTDIDLLQTPEYTFTAKTTDYESRFRLVFTTNGDDASAGSGTFAFFNGSEWQISNEGKATLQVIDVMGRVLSTETISGNAEVSIHQPAGIYMLRLVNGDDVKVQKVVVH